MLSQTALNTARRGSLASVVKVGAWKMPGATRLILFWTGRNLTAMKKRQIPSRKELTEAVARMSPSMRKRYAEAKLNKKLYRKVKVRF